MALIVGQPVGLLDEEHGGHDRARAGQQRRAQRHQRDVGGDLLARVVGLAGQQLQRDQDSSSPPAACNAGRSTCR